MFIEKRNGFLRGLDMELVNFGHIEKDIYRSGYIDKVNFPAICEKGVKSIICLKTDVFSATAERHLCYPDISFRHIPLQLTSVNLGEKEKLYFAVNFLVDLPRPILIHDETGANRVGLVCALFRKTKQKWGENKIRYELNSYGFNPIFYRWIDEIIKA
jgi:protein tyrosine/serine phosphatase